MAVPTDIADLSTTASNNSPSGGDFPSVIDDTLRAHGAIIKQNVSKGADIASGSTITVPDVGSFFVVTGTTTINGINDCWNGRIIYLRFDGALQLTHSASLILPTNANITTAAGDVMAFVNEGSSIWRGLFYTDASATILKEADIGSTVQAHSAVLDATTASFTSADETKLDGVETGATADQAWGDIAGTLSNQTDLQTALDGKAASTVGQGQHTIWIPAGAIVPEETGGPVAGSIEYPANHINLDYLDYDASTNEDAQFTVQMPKGWDQGTVIFQCVWTDADTAGTGNVRWQLSGLAIGDNDAIDSTFGATATVIDTFIATGDLHATNEGTVTIGGTPAAEDFVVFKVRRNGANGGDTYTQDARLLGVRLHYTTDAATDD